MEVVDKGHHYLLKKFDIDSTIPRFVREDELVFVKREGAKYPGNIGHHPGTITQEVLRALIDRTKYVDNQLPCFENKQILDNLRSSLLLLEIRAARIRGKKLILVNPMDNIEEQPTCDVCGHILCTENHDEEKEITDNTT